MATYPHGGAATIYADFVDGSPYDPKEPQKSQIRDLLVYIQTLLETLEGATGDPDAIADILAAFAEKADKGTDVATGARAGSKWTDIASSSTTNLASADGGYGTITGTTTITALGTANAGIVRIARFAAALTLTHNATSLILPTGANIVTAAGDIAFFVSLGSGNWVCLAYTRASGFPLTGTRFVATLSEAVTGTRNDVDMTPLADKEALDTRVSPTERTVKAVRRRQADMLGLDDYTLSLNPRTVAFAAACASAGAPISIRRQNTHSRLMDRLDRAGITALNASGCGIWLLGDSKAQAKINHLNPGTNDLVEHGSPTYTVNIPGSGGATRGWAAASASDYLDTGIDAFSFPGAPALWVDVTNRVISTGYDIGDNVALCSSRSPRRATAIARARSWATRRSPMRRRVSARQAGPEPAGTWRSANSAPPASTSATMASRSESILARPSPASWTRPTRSASCRRPAHRRFARRTRSGPPPFSTKCRKTSAANSMPRPRTICGRSSSATCSSMMSASARPSSGKT